MAAKATTKVKPTKSDTGSLKRIVRKNKVTSQGSSKYTRFKSKNARRMKKISRGQG